MLFTAPAFVFLFLPLAIIFYTLFGKARPRICLILISAVYHILMSMSHPLNLIWLPLLIVYTYIGGRVASIQRRRAITAAIALIPIIWLVVMRYLEFFDVERFVYPVGITLPALSATAYIWSCFNERESGGFFMLWLYLNFFPIMLVGPFIGFKEFCRLTEKENISFTLSDISGGIGLYALGFIKRIAVGAVLIDGYGKIFAYSWEAPSVGTILLLIVLIYFGVFFSLSGYYDMGVGISRMFGIAVPQVSVNPLTVATVNEYSKGLFSNVRDWACVCIVEPLYANSQRPPSAAFKTAVYCLCTVVFVSAEPWILSLAIPLIAFALASGILRLDKKDRQGHAGLRVLFGMLTILVMGAFWIFVTMGGGSSSVLEFISDMTVNNAEYQTDMVLIAFSGTKYLFVSVVGLVILLASTKAAARVRANLSARIAAIVDYGAMVSLLAIFVFTVIFFLPQFEIYSTVPFSYITI